MEYKGAKYKPTLTGPITPIYTIEDALRMIREHCYYFFGISFILFGASLFVTLIMNKFTTDSFDYFIHAVLFIIIAIFILKFKSRFFAVLSLLTVVYLGIMSIYLKGFDQYISKLLTFILLFASICCVRATFWYHKLAKTYVTLNKGLFFISLLIAFTAVTISIKENFFPMLAEFMFTKFEAGKEFGLTTDNNGCVEDALDKINKSRIFITDLKTMGFLNGCLITSQTTKGFCDNVPIEEESKQYKIWPRQHCIELRQKDPFCETLFYAVQVNCSDSGSMESN